MDTGCGGFRPLPTRGNLASANRTAAPKEKNPDNQETACCYGEPGEMENNAISWGQILERPSACLSKAGGNASLRYSFRSDDETVDRMQRYCFKVYRRITRGGVAA